MTRNEAIDIIRQSWDRSVTFVFRNLLVTQ